MRHASAPRILVTGFGSFPGMPRNPSARVALALTRSRRLGAAEIEARILPTQWAVAERFADALEEAAPDIVVMIGVAGRRRHVAIELVASNATGMFPDAARRRPAARRLDRKGPVRRDVRAAPMPLLRALREAGAPARLSRDAGRYVCNALAWQGYGWAARRTEDRPRLAVFVHIPLPRADLVTAATLTRAAEALLVALIGQYRAGARLPARAEPAVAAAGIASLQPRAAAAR